MTQLFDFDELKREIEDYSKSAGTNSIDVIKMKIDFNKMIILDDIYRRR